MSRQTHPRCCPSIPRIPSAGLELFSGTPPAACASMSSLQISFNDALAPLALQEEAEKSFEGGRNTWKCAAVPPDLCRDFWGVVSGQCTPSLTSPRAVPGFGDPPSFGCSV